MRWRSWVIITPPKRDDPLYPFILLELLTVLLPQSGFVQRLLTTLDARFIPWAPRKTFKERRSIVVGDPTEELA